MRRILASVVLLLALAGCAGGGVFATAPLPPDPHTQMAALENRIFELIEDERMKIDPKAKPLALDSELTGIARAKSDDMAGKNYLAHQAPDGETTTASMIMDKDADFQGLLGENIAAQHYTKQSGVDVDAFARRFVDEWLASDTHKQNLAYAPYDRTGVGASVSGDTVYVTQLFATDLGLPPPSQQHTRGVQQYSDPKSASDGSRPPPDAQPIIPRPRPDA